MRANLPPRLEVVYRGQAQLHRPLDEGIADICRRTIVRLATEKQDVRISFA